MAPTRIYIEDSDTSADAKLFVQRSAAPQTISGLVNDEPHVIVNTAASDAVTPTGVAVPAPVTLIDAPYFDGATTEEPPRLRVGIAHAIVPATYTVTPTSRSWEVLLSNAAPITLAGPSYTPDPLNNGQDATIVETATFPGGETLTAISAPYEIFTSASAETLIDLGDGFTMLVAGSPSIVTHVDGVVQIVSSGPVEVLQVTPATVGEGADLRHGHVINPAPIIGSANGVQGFDGRRSYYTAALTAPATFTLNPTDTVILSRSVATLPAASDQGRLGWSQHFRGVYVSATAADPLRPGPVLVRPAGNTTLSYVDAVDYLDRAAALPTTYDVPTATVPTIEQIEYALRFNPMHGMRTHTIAQGGYESFFPSQWTQQPPISGNSGNYGQSNAERMTDIFMLLFFPTARVPLATKAAILRLCDSYAHHSRSAWRLASISIGPDGAHQQQHQFPLILADWLRGVQPDLTGILGNWSQAYPVPQQDVDAWAAGYGDPDALNDYTGFEFNSHVMKRRRVTASAGNTVTMRIWRDSLTTQGDPSYIRWPWFEIVRPSDGATATIVSDSRTASPTGFSTKTVTIDAQPVPPFAADDVVFMRPKTALVLGAADWRERTSQRNNFTPNATVSYRGQAKWTALMFTRMLGAMTDDMAAAWEYFKRSHLPDDPPGDDYPSHNGALSLYDQDLVALHLSAMDAIPQPYLAPDYYPAVPAVDLTAASASLAFPEGNNGPGALLIPTQKGALAQSRTGIAQLPASTVPWAGFAIVRLPKGKRFWNSAPGIFGLSGSGGNIYRIRFNGEDSGNTPVNVFEAYNQGSSGSSAQPKSVEWTEDAALVVFWCDGASNWGLDWYSLIDGTRYAGTPVVAAGGANSINAASATFFQIGGASSATTYTANGGGYNWPGEIEAVGIATTGVTPAQWADIATGADIVATIGAANLKWLREFDGTTDTLAKPAAATADVSPASILVTGNGTTVPDSTILPGSTLRRQSPADWLTMNGLSHGWVYGLAGGETERPVPFAGEASASKNGETVEVRVIEVGTGRVVRDWTAVATVASGAWSGNLTLPQAEDWWIAQARCAGAQFDRRDEFAVGFKFLILGQSQMEIALVGDPAVSGVPANHLMSATYLSNQETPDNRMFMGRVSVAPVRASGQRFDSTGVRAFINQFRQFDPLTPIMLIKEAIQGTGSQQFIDDSGAVPTSGLREWSLFQAKLDAFGNDISAIVINWGTSETGAGDLDETVMANNWNAMFFGTGPAVRDHDMTTALRPGWRVAVSPLTRHTNRGAAPSRVRRRQVNWAIENPTVAAVGPPVSDMRIEAPGGPHQVGDDPNGNRVVMARMAIAAAKAMGLTNPQNPHFTTATRSGAVITINVALPNGGTLFSRAPTALRSFAVNEAGTESGSVTTGFTAAISGSTVTLTKTSGTWAAGTWVGYRSDLEDRANGDVAAELAIMEGALYETWADDVVTGWGLPVLGGLDGGGNWVPDWDVVVA